MHALMIVVGAPPPIFFIFFKLKPFLWIARRRPRQVNVRREDLGTGHRWEVSFTKAIGNLPEMVAHMHRYEEQHVRTLGGDPTPLGGSFSLGYGGASTGPIAFDASAAAVKLALESLPTLSRVDVARDVYNFGQYRWRVTFR